MCPSSCSFPDHGYLVERKDKSPPHKAEMQEILNTLKSIKATDSAKTIVSNG